MYPSVCDNIQYNQTGKATQDRTWKSDDVHLFGQNLALCGFVRYSSSSGNEYRRESHDVSTQM